MVNRPHAIAVLATLIVLAVASLALAKGPPVVGLANRRFDHDRHAASARAGGKPAECASCHADSPRAEHARCVGCHQFPSACTTMKTPGPAGPARVCRTCHVSTRPDCLPGDLPPLPAGDSFTAKFTHAKHLSVGASIERDCGLCHRAQAEPPAQKPHVLCSGCHNPNGARPAMTECAVCHVAATAKPPAPRAADPFRIARFDHRAHTAASKLTACLSCHDTPVGDAPRTAMLGCQTRCHDGKQAFAATGTHCTRCHTGAAPAPATRTDAAFSHAEHARRSVAIDDCAACHVLDNDGTLAAPLSRKDHQPCANAGCHQAEYAARAPKICGVCHEIAAPWTRAAARSGKRTRLEWFDAINHATHASGRATCESCHGDKRTGGEAPRGHRACATCHSHGPAPAMTECKACHRSTQLMTRRPSEWSVAATFDHPRHAIDPRTRTPSACTTCHPQVAVAKDIVSLPPPRMADCDGCHDGKTAFKTTGFGCARCHGPKVVPGQTGGVGGVADARGAR